MKEIFAVLLAMVAFAACSLGIAWIVQGNDFALYRYFGPKLEDTRREIFEHSKAYRQGMIQELENMQFQYEQASPSQKEGLSFIILHCAADVDQNMMPPPLASFIIRLRCGSAEKSHEEFH